MHATTPHISRSLPLPLAEVREVFPPLPIADCPPPHAKNTPSTANGRANTEGPTCAQGQTAREANGWSSDLKASLHPRPRHLERISLFLQDRRCRNTL